ncbi:MAG: phage/plasmid primase, P4 family [Thermofilum sp.]|uniref:DNA primase family protein n=1 Tax=Thermofilum sp. TaxID=1961369 RepID=UPI0031697728
MDNYSEGSNKPKRVENRYEDPLINDVKSIKTEIKELKPLALGKHEGWFTLGDAYIVLRFTKESTKIVVIKDGSVIGNYVARGFLNCWNMQIVVDGVDICGEIAKLVENYSDLVEQYELVEKAKAIRLLDYKAVPSMPKEWEVLIYSLTKYVLNTRIIKTFYIYEGPREVVLGIYCYENGYYRECEETLKHEISRMVSESNLLDMKLAPSLVGNVVRNIEMRTLEYYNPAKRCLLFKDKVFCWDPFLDSKDIEKALLDPSPDLIVTHRIPWELKPDILKRAREGLLKYVPPKNQEDLIELFKALAPKSFKAFLDWVKKPGEDEKEAYPRVVLLLEIIGYTLYPHDYPLHKAVLLVGEGSNGKSTYLRLIEAILSKANVSNVSLSDLDPRVNRFAAADLYNKLANISSEPPKRTFDPTLFKMLTGEDLVRMERKFRDSFNAYNYAKMIFAANELPQITEDTYAFWRRWIVIEFTNRFDPDPTFFERTFTPDEIEVIILLALHAFRLVLERKGFTEAGVEDVREEWLSRSNPVYRVVKKMIDDGIIEFSRDGVVVKTDLYELYKKYIDILNEEGYELSPLEQKDFTRHLTRYFPIRTGGSRIGGKKKHVYFGVRIKDYDKALELVGHLETPRGL